MLGFMLLVWVNFSFPCLEPRLHSRQSHLLQPRLSQPDGWADLQEHDVPLLRSQHCCLQQTLHSLAYAGQFYSDSWPVVVETRKVVEPLTTNLEVKGLNPAAAQHHKRMVEKEKRFLFLFFIFLQW